MNFNKLKLDARLLHGIKDRGYFEMTDVQQKTLEHTLQGRDVAVQSQTGTGKTAAFLITIFEQMCEKTISQRKKALVLLPTRELAVQIDKEAQLLNRHLKFEIGSFYGGVGYNAQLSQLKRGVDVIIGTPGRLMDLSQKGHINLKDIGFLIIDEADRLFDMGFLPEIKKLIQKMPPANFRHNMLFSATLNRFSKEIAARYMNRPVFIEITPERMTVDSIEQELYHVKSHVKLNLMLGILKSESPQNALIFSNTRHATARLSQRLKTNGFRSQYLTGDLPQNRRLKIIADFMAGKFTFLVATDVAARGLHIDNLEMVINYDIPQDCENYVHRIGRTGRAGNTGKAISFVSEGKINHLDAIESFIGMKIPVQKADIDLYATDLSCTGYNSNKKSYHDGPKNKNRSQFAAKRSQRNIKPGRSRFAYS